MASLRRCASRTALTPLCCRSSASIRHIPKALFLNAESSIQPPSSRKRFAAAQATPRNSPKAKPSPAEVFTLAEIPFDSFQIVIENNGDAFRKFTPQKYYQCAQKFSEAVQRGSDPWSFVPKDKSLSAELLHATACIMRQLIGVRAADAFSSAMWASASALGYTPSTLSLARQLIRSGAFGKFAPLQKVEFLFKQLVATAKDPNALTAHGELLFGQGKYESAAQILEKALRTDSTSFEWKPYCQLCLGKASAKLQKPQQARDLLNSAAEAGLAEADFELGKLLQSQSPDVAREHFYTSGANGRWEAFSHLAQIDMGKASTATSDSETRRDALLWATEWSKLAGQQA